jgi:hypothetical protein
MTNLLTKDRQPYVPPVASTPGSPGIPARYVWESTTVCGIYASNITYGWTEPTDGSDPAYIPVSVDATRPATYTYRCVTERRRRYVPAVPGTAATPGGSIAAALAATLSIGWTGGARSLGVLTTDGHAVFELSAVVGGIVVGFNDVDDSTSFLEINHGLYFSGGTVRVIEGGAIKASVGSYVNGDTFKIDRASGTVTYYKGATLLYTSLVASTGTVFLDVSMYAAGDAITDPVLTETATALTGGSGAITLTALGALGFEGDAQAQAVLQLPMLTFIASGGIAQPQIAYGGAGMPALLAGGTGLTGETGSSAITLRALDALGWQLTGGVGRGSAGVTMPALEITADALEGNLNATLGGAPVWTTAAMEGPRVAVATITSEIGVTSTLLVIALKSGVMSSTMTVDDDQLVQAIRLATMSTAVTVSAATTRTSSGDTTGRDDGFEVWSIDLDSLAGSMYEHYDFNSYADLEGVAYGAKADGVYLLEGDRDEGAIPIRASVDFGRHNMGTNLEKRVPHVYMGVATSGQLVLRVTVDGGPSYNYTALNPKDQQQVVRFDPGKGLKGSYWKFELFNVAGVDLDVDTIEFTPVIVPRRIL